SKLEEKHVIDKGINSRILTQKAGELKIPTNSGATATQHSQYNPGSGKIRICSPADSRTSPHALRSILSTHQNSKPNLIYRKDKEPSIIRAPNSPPIGYHSV